MSWQVDVLHYGTQRVPGAQVFYQAHWDEWQTFNFYVFLATGPDGVLLIDCGMDRPDGLNAFIAGNMGEENCIRHVSTGGLVADLLAGRGLTPADVDAVALTHLHVDHSGNLAQFPRARVVLGRDGWDAHLRRRQTNPGMVGEPAFPRDALGAVDAAARDGRLLLGEDDEEVLPGLRVRTIGGHTDDSTGLVLDSTAGRLVFPGDTIWTYENLATDSPVGSSIDLGACFEAMAWAREAGDELMPSHDPELLERHRGRVVSAS
ncbi:MBL fold metallo-hydrolase [Micromonospora sp. NPDC005113]